MSRLLLALAILAAGGGGFLAALRSTNQLTWETSASRDTWLVQTQQLAAVHSEQADLAERMHQLKASLAQSQPVAENALWSSLKTNRADRLPPDLRERVLEELAFNWQFSPDSIVVTKQALRDTGVSRDAGPWVLKNGKLCAVETAVLAMTPEESAQVEAAMQSCQAEVNDWAVAHVERSDSKDDVVAKYVLPGDPALLLSLSNNFAAAVFPALGRERAEWVLASAGAWMVHVGLKGQTSMVIKRELAGNQPRLKAEIEGASVNAIRLGYLPELAFPAAFRPVFPNGWADIAKREGFELPEEQPQKK